MINKLLYPVFPILIGIVIYSCVKEEFVDPKASCYEYYDYVEVLEEGYYLRGNFNGTPYWALNANVFEFSPRNGLDDHFSINFKEANYCNTVGWEGSVTIESKLETKKYQIPQYNYSEPLLGETKETKTTASVIYYNFDSVEEVATHGLYDSVVLSQPSYIDIQEISEDKKSVRGEMVFTSFQTRCRYIEGADSCTNYPIENWGPEPDSIFFLAEFNLPYEYVDD